jgi:hypothetical protein
VFQLNCCLRGSDRKPHVKTNKSDYIDAEAIAEGLGRPTMRLVPVKSDDQPTNWTYSRSIGPSPQELVRWMANPYEIDRGVQGTEMAMKGERHGNLSSAGHKRADSSIEQLVDLPARLVIHSKRKSDELNVHEATCWKLLLRRELNSR